MQEIRETHFHDNTVKTMQVEEVPQITRRTLAEKKLGVQPEAWSQLVAFLNRRNLPGNYSCPQGLECPNLGREALNCNIELTAHVFYM